MKLRTASFVTPRRHARTFARSSRNSLPFDNVRSMRMHTSSLSPSADPSRLCAKTSHPRQGEAQAAVQVGAADTQGGAERGATHLRLSHHCCTRTAPPTRAAVPRYAAPRIPARVRKPSKG